VLHSFRRNPKKGIATPKKEIDLIKRRLRDAIEHGKAGRHEHEDHSSSGNVYADLGFKNPTSMR